MSEPSSWDLVKIGQFESACDAAEREAAKYKSKLRLGNKIIALLNMGRFDDVIKLCGVLIADSAQAGGSDAYFIDAGIAFWLMGNCSSAINAWRESKNCKYSDAAGGLTAPLLLLFASSKTGDDDLRTEAISLIANIKGTSHGIGWPGALAPYALGITAEEDVYSQLSKQPIVQQRQLCTAHFHIGAKYLKHNIALSIEHMKQSIRGIPSILLQSEYYLAKGELIEHGIMARSEWSKLPVER